MKIKKLAGDITHSSTTIRKTFDLNGKKVVVISERHYSDYGDDDESDTIEEGVENLTDKQVEILEDNLPEILELKDNEEMEIK